MSVSLSDVEQRQSTREQIQNDLREGLHAKLVDRGVRNHRCTTNAPCNVHSTRFRGRADLGWILRARTAFGRESGRLSDREDYSLQGESSVREMVGIRLVQELVDTGKGCSVTQEGLLILITYIITFIRFCVF